MKKLKKKVMGVILAAVLAVSAVPGWAEESAKETAVPKEAIDPYNGLEPEAVVLTVGEDQVPLKKAYFLLKFQQAIVQEMQKGVYGNLWYRLPIYEGDRTFQDNMKESIINLLVRMSLARQHQEEYGVSISDKEKEQIEKTVETFFAGNSDKALEAMMADKEILTEILTDYTILSKVITSITKGVKAGESEAKTYSYVYASFGDKAVDLNDPDESAGTLIENFQNIHDKAAAGGNLDQAAAEAGYPTALHTYFAEDEGDQLAELNQIMDQLEQGEVSEVSYVGNNHGIFIGRRQEVDPDSLESAKQSLLKNEQLKQLKKTIQQWTQETTYLIKEEIWSQVTMEKAIAAYQDPSKE